MGKKSGVPKCRKKRRDRKNPCGCHYCTGTSYEEWLNLKYDLKPKHKNGTNGVFIGYQAGKSQVSGNGSFIGYEAGSHGSNQDQNIMIGVNYGNNITTGNKGIKFGNLNK